jgi:hypothetical protein
MLTLLSSFILIALVSGTSSTDIPPDALCERDEEDHSYCLRCHSMASLAHLNAEGWRAEELFIDPRAYAISNHSKLNCLDCHTYGLAVFPHSYAARNADRHEEMSCVGCHVERAPIEKFHFPSIEQQFRQSVHQERLPGMFSCFSCHDPHRFDIPDLDKNIRFTVESSNDRCIRCHLSSVRFDELTSRPLPQLRQSHNWLPNPQLHWKHVRCVECHTPHEREFSHRILPSSTAERMCEQCHTRNSILLTTLYRHRTTESRQNTGFINSVVFNEAYIIGMTRNIFFDWVSNILFALVLLGISGHAILRATMSRRRKNDK